MHSTNRWILWSTTEQIRLRGNMTENIKVNNICSFRCCCPTRKRPMWLFSRICAVVFARSRARALARTYCQLFCTYSRTSRNHTYSFLHRLSSAFVISFFSSFMFLSCLTSAEQLCWFTECIDIWWFHKEKRKNNVTGLPPLRRLSIPVETIVADLWPSRSPCPTLHTMFSHACYYVWKQILNILERGKWNSLYFMNACEDKYWTRVPVNLLKLPTTISMSIWLNAIHIYLYIVSFFSWSPHFFLVPV